MQRLTAIDGRNPLGFLAALGAAAALDAPLSWQYEVPRWTPTLHVPADESVADRLYELLKDTPFAYRLSGIDATPFDDLKAPKSSGSRKRSMTPSAFAACLDDFTRLPEALERPFSCRATQQLAALTCATARNFKTGDWTLSATRTVSGQTAWLANLRAIVEGTQRGDLHRALFERWQYRPNPKTSFDPDTYLQNIGENVGGLGAVSEIGAERLALEAMRLLVTGVKATRLTTRGMSRTSSCEAFIWPLWDEPLLPAAAGMLLDHSMLYENELRVLRKWARVTGVSVIFRAEVFTYGQGYRTLLRPEQRF
ncbi:MAG: type I-G CRISPR-associated protein, Cas3-extension family [Vulcanimicrobiaceae bacterium]